MKTMRKISSFLFVTGLLLIAGAAFFCISNLREERTAGKIADDVAFRIYAEIGRASWRERVWYRV